MKPRPFDPGPIRSRQNPAVRRAREVGRRKDPDAMLLEGARLVRDARQAGAALELVLVDERHPELAEGLPAELVRLADPGVLAHVSTLDSCPGIVAVARRPAGVPLAALDLEGDALLVVACGVQDPGNLGALARSAEAFGARALAVPLGGANPYAPKALRGSMGSLLRLPLIAVGEGPPEAAAENLLGELEQHGFRSLRAVPRGGAPLDTLDWSGRVALWVGAETGAFPASADRILGVTIPMEGRVESLNLAVAAAILLHDAARWRRPARGETVG